MLVTSLMILIFDCLVLITVLNVVRIFIKLIMTPSVINTNKEKQSHQVICDVIEQLGMGSFDGVCYGFTLNWASAVALGNEELFYRKINLLRLHHDNLATLLELIKKKKLEQQDLTEDELLLETLPALCEQICRAQKPYTYKKEYGKLVWQSDINAILKDINPHASCPKHIFSKTHTLPRSEAISYFRKLKKIDSNVSVLIASLEHAMGFKRAGKRWRFIDINSLFKNKGAIYQEFTSKGLVTALCSATDDMTLPMVRLTFNIDFISLRPAPYLVRPLEQLFPTFPPGDETNKKEKIYFFAMAALQGDILTVKKCLEAGWSIFSHHPINENSPVLNAVVSGRSDVVKIMLLEKTHQVNKTRKRDHATLLHNACQYGGTLVIAELLKVPGINIDAQDKFGKSPLMWACVPSVFTRDETLFELLLRHGASVTLKDNEGLSALDHATKNQHKIAEAMISAKLKQIAEPKQYSSPLVFFKRAPVIPVQTIEVDDIFYTI